MKIEVIDLDRNGIHLIKVEGRLDANFSSQLEDRIDQLIAEKTHKIILDFSDVTYLSSSGLRVLLSLKKETENRGGLVLIHLRDIVKKDDWLISLDNPEFVNQTALDSKKLAHESAQREYTTQQGVYDKGGITLKDLADAQKAFVDSTYSFDNGVLALKKLEVRDPFDGVIVDLPHFTDRQLVDANTVVIRVMDYARLYADLTLPGKEMDRLSQGQRVIVTDYSQPNTAINGTVTEISPALDADSRMFKLRIGIPNPALKLKPGSFIKTDIVVQEKPSALVIPKSIILDRRGAKTVFVIERGIALERRIQTGIENVDEAEVTSGLKPLDRVVTDGFETLRANARVKILE
jgi:membrane fusion protein (multidrug efflux system)